MSLNTFIIWVGISSWPILLSIFAEAVRLFYSNFRSFGLHTRTFTTLVYGHLVTVPLEYLRHLLNIPRVGEILANETELVHFNFNIEHEFVHLTGHTPDVFLTLPSAFLLPSLRTFHFFLTRQFLPWTVLLDRVTPLDLWIIAHVVANVPLDYCHLLFGGLYPFQQFEYLGHLHFGPLIIRLILCLGISLDPFRTTTLNVYLTADDILDEIADDIVEWEDDEDMEEETAEEESGEEPEEEPAEVEGESEEEPEKDPDIEVNWISSDDSGSESSDTDPGSPPLDVVFAALQDVYGSD
ncbi:unnamed protein product [Linum trigynum]|uniref:Uncharacterized protein n=2 Tax=Linum trigynum TaxID=586398 RepID=A0AAV2F383_9ROSI